MQRLWSPWRSRHIERMTEDNGGKSDIFEIIARHPEHDERNFVLWRGNHVFVVLNLFPYNNGHLLIVPYRPVRSFVDLSTNERSELTHAIELCMRWLTSALSPDGYNVGMNIGTAAGAGIPDHFHTHVIPRWTGDTNFMPVAADVKVVPEAMEKTFRKLKDAQARERAG